MFIRTKSDVEDLDDYYVEEELNGHPYVHKQFAWCIYKESILKQSENIEDLLDEFIVIKPSGDKIITTNARNVDVYRERDGFVVKGGIWTDWGLRFVAVVRKEDNKWIVV